MNQQYQHNPSFYKSPIMQDSSFKTISAEENALLQGLDVFKTTAHSRTISKNNKQIITQRSTNAAGQNSTQHGATDRQDVRNPQKDCFVKSSSFQKRQKSAGERPKQETSLYNKNHQFQKLSHETNQSMHHSRSTSSTSQILVSHLKIASNKAKNLPKSTHIAQTLNHNNNSNNINYNASLWNRIIHNTSATADDSNNNSALNMIRSNIDTYLNSNKSHSSTSFHSKNASISQSYKTTNEQQQYQHQATFNRLPSTSGNVSAEIPQVFLQKNPHDVHSMSNKLQNSNEIPQNPSTNSSSLQKQHHQKINKNALINPIVSNLSNHSLSQAKSPRYQSHRAPIQTNKTPGYLSNRHVSSQQQQQAHQDDQQPYVPQHLKNSTKLSPTHQQLLLQALLKYPTLNQHKDMSKQPRQESNQQCQDNFQIYSESNQLEDENKELDGSNKIFSFLEHEKCSHDECIYNESSLKLADSPDILLKQTSRDALTQSHQSKGRNISSSPKASSLCFSESLRSSQEVKQKQQESHWDEGVYQFEAEMTNGVQSIEKEQKREEMQKFLKFIEEEVMIELQDFQKQLHKMEKQRVAYWKSQRERSIRFFKDCIDSIQRVAKSTLDELDVVQESSILEIKTSQIQSQTNIEHLEAMRGDITQNIEQIVSEIPLSSINSIIESYQETCKQLMGFKNSVDMNQSAEQKTISARLSGYYEGIADQIRDLVEKMNSKCKFAGYNAEKINQRRKEVLLLSPECSSLKSEHSGLSSSLSRRGYGREQFPYDGREDDHCQIFNDNSFLSVLQADGTPSNTLSSDNKMKNNCIKSDHFSKRSNILEYTKINPSGLTLEGNLDSRIGGSQFFSNFFTQSSTATHQHLGSPHFDGYSQIDYQFKPLSELNIQEDFQAQEDFVDLGIEQQNQGAK